MKHSARILPIAQRDVEHFRGYIAERSPQGAVAWFDRMAKAVHELERNPQIHGIAYESSFVDYEIRETFFKTKSGLPYRILFTILDSEVIVLRVRGPGQDFLADQDLPDRSDF